MARMTTPSSGPQHPSSSGAAGAGGADGARHGRRRAESPVDRKTSALDGWSVLPLAVRISSRSSVPDVDGSDLLGPDTADAAEIVGFVPTAQGICKVLGHHRAVAAAAEGSDYLQIAVLVDDQGRTATVGEHGAVVPGQGVEEIAASVHRITGQTLEPQHPRLQRALILHLDAPELPLLASSAGATFRAVSRDGWSVLVPDDDASWWALRTGVTGTAVALASDGAARSLEVLLDGADGVGRHPETARPDPTRISAESSGDRAACGLSWGPAWSAVSIDDDGTPAARLTREVLELCDGETTQMHVESVASVFDLDPVQTVRLRNYVDGETSSLVLESVLQLLELPVLAAKIVEGQKPLSEIEGLERFEPTSMREAVMQGLGMEPTDDSTFSRLQARLAERPEILLAAAGAQTAVGIGLAALGRRGGRGGLVLGTLSGLAFTDAASLSGLYAVLRRQRRRRDGRRPGRSHD